MSVSAKPRLAVYKFASCDGCQLSLLDCEDELLAVAGEVEIANFPEASRAVMDGPYDLTLVEGSVTTPHDAERIQEVRRQSRFLVTIGACATAGGIQALRNFRDVKAFARLVYARPDYIETLDGFFDTYEEAHEAGTDAAQEYAAENAAMSDDPEDTYENLLANMAVYVRQVEPEDKW